MTTINTVTAKPTEAPIVSTARLTVMQPEKLGDLLNTISLIDKISERSSGGPANDFTTSSGASGGTKQDDTQSVREKAIAELPSMHIMQKNLETRMNGDIKKIYKQLQTSGLKAHKPGSAYRYSVLYGKIRRLRSVMAATFSASADVIRRLYIRIFIDKQEVL